MTPIIEALYVAAVAGVACAAIRVVLSRPVVRETRRALPDHLVSWLRELPEVRSEDVFLTPVVDEPEEEVAAR